jgi:hypothetical protein
MSRGKASILRGSDLQVSRKHGRRDRADGFWRSLISIIMVSFQFVVPVFQLFEFLPKASKKIPFS